MQPYDVVYMAYYTSPSDGVVPSFSQINEGGAWQGFHLEAVEVNHGEFKDPNRVKFTLNQVFDGSASRPDIFKIAYR